MTETIVSSEAQRVIDWRLKRLLDDGGFKVKNAEKIADSDIDYRLAIDLHRKCPDEKLVMKILFGSNRKVVIHE